MASTSDRADAPIRVLLISFHFPPMNAISAFRAEGFARHLPTLGMEVSVLTSMRDPVTGVSFHQPSGTSPVVDLWESSTVYRIPRIPTRFHRFVQVSLKVPVWSGLTAFALATAGTFNAHMLDVHRGYKRFLRKHLRDHTYDVVLASAPPDEHLALGAWIQARYHIPFIADHRDLYDAPARRSPEAIGLRERVLYGLKHVHHRRWARHTALCTTISRPMLDRLGRDLPGVPGREVRNGYHPEKILHEETYIRRDRFRITYAGRIYPGQRVEVFARAYRTFVEVLTEEERSLVDLRMYGCQDPERIGRIHQEMTGLPYHIQADRIPEAENYRLIAESSVLLVFDIGIEGGYTGKLMDYLGCRRNVLLVPTDGGVMEQLVRDARIGLATNDPAAAARQLVAWFREWQAEGRPHFQGNELLIAQGTRQAQTALLAEAIRTVVGEQRKG